MAISAPSAKGVPSTVLHVLIHDACAAVYATRLGVTRAGRPQSESLTLSSSCGEELAAVKLPQRVAMADTELELRALGVTAVRTAEVEQNVIAAAEARAAAAGQAPGADAAANAGAVPDGGAADAEEAESAAVVSSLCGSQCTRPSLVCF